MTLRISQRQVRDVTILDLSGVINLGEGSVTLRDIIRSLVHECKIKILLNMGEVTYIDSSGVGEMVSAHTTVRAKGGKLKLLDLTKKCRDLLQITKFYTVFDVFETPVETEDEAVASFGELPRCHCPVCGYLSRPPLLDLRASWRPQTCKNPSCEATFTVIATGDSEREPLLLNNIRLETYKNEYFEIVPGPPVIVTIIGRLDLFSSTALRKVRQALPGCRKMVFALHSVTELDDAGRSALISFVRVANQTKDASAVVSLEGVSPEHMILFPVNPPFYSSKTEALRALGNVLDDAPPTVKIDLQ